MLRVYIDCGAMESEFKSHFPIFLDVQFRESYFIFESSFLNTNTEIVTKLAGTLLTDRGHNVYIPFPFREHPPWDHFPAVIPLISVILIIILMWF